MFNFDHESPSLRHEQFALEEYTVVIFRLADALAALLTPVTSFSKLLGMRIVAAFRQAELLRFFVQIQ
ncbi:hypothetical protein DD573_14225 [Klebsiella pneumoniae]|nr:hypothetical protein DD573_14225 [Klebsiella pneumoniae]